MRREMALAAAVALLALSAAPPVARAADHWPVRQGIAYHFERADGGSLDLESAECPSGDATCLSWQVGLGGGTLFVTDGPPGDVLLSGIACWGELGVVMRYDPALPLIDGPLAVGASWTWTGTINDWPADEVGFSIEEATTVTVPAGTFDVLVLRIEPPECLGGVFYLDRDLGPVRIDDFELVDYSGITATEAATWGSLKGLYR